MGANAFGIAPQVALNPVESPWDIISLENRSRSKQGKADLTRRRSFLTAFDGIQFCCDRILRVGWIVPYQTVAWWPLLKLLP